MKSVQTEPAIRFPQILVADDLESALPLEHTLVNVQITGLTASVVVTQRFGNPLAQPAELDYLFPLPDGAAITGFELQVGSRRIIGDLQEREAARAGYETAREQGKRAGLFEQRRPNLFAVRLANIQAGEVIQSTARYQQRLDYEDGSFEFHFPMGLTPKYDRPDHPEEGRDSRAPLAKTGEKIGPVEIFASLDAGMAVLDPTSPSHALQVSRVDERRLQVQVGGQTIPDHDFILRYALASDQAQIAGWSSGEVGKEYFTAALVPPPMEDEPEVPPREFIFVLDRSGSMTGEPIAQARNALRACLRSLNPADTFRILLFDHELEWLDREALPVDQAQVDRADAFLAAVKGRGGTEILRAIEAALALPVDARRTRFVVFLTDGAVSAEGQVLEQVRSRIGAARLFTFGVGPSVNRALLNRMARLGRGRSDFLQLNEDIEGAIIRFQDSVSFPVISGLSISWVNGKAWDVYPSRLPDLYYGEPLNLCGRLARNGQAPVQLTVQGIRAGKPVQLQASIQPPAARDQALERIWAQARAEDLLEEESLDPTSSSKLRGEILGLALEHNLVTPYTSFVALDQDLASPGVKPRVIHVAQPLPEGLQAEGFINRPVSAMGAALPISMPPPASSAPGNLLRSVMSKLSSKADMGNRDVPRNLPPQPAARGFAELSSDASGPALSGGREALLRWLVRHQNLDGSWEGEVEQTAAALLAFARAGYTTRSGPFRQPLRRAFRWLVEHPTSGPSGFIRALALQELSQASGDENDKSAAQAAWLVAGSPSSPLERAAAGEKVQPPEGIHTIDDLRLAALLKAELQVPEALISTNPSILVVAWAAAQL